MKGEMKIKDLLTDESKWTKEADARASDGRVVDPMSNEATCWCLRGLIRRCYPDRPETYNVFSLLGYKIGVIHHWNDAPERTFAEVKALVEELDI